MERYGASAVGAEARTPRGETGAAVVARLEEGGAEARGVDAGEGDAVARRDAEKGEEEAADEDAGEGDGIG